MSQLDFTTSNSLTGTAGLKKTDDLSKKFEFDENNRFKGFWGYVDTVIENMGVVTFDPTCDPLIVIGEPKVDKKPK